LAHRSLLVNKHPIEELVPYSTFDFDAGRLCASHPSIAIENLSVLEFPLIGIVLFATGWMIAIADVSMAFARFTRQF
jgi:hypothetical protein